MALFQAKKETRSLRDYEHALLGNYRHYLEFMEALAAGKRPKTRDKEKRKKPQGNMCKILKLCTVYT